MFKGLYTALISPFQKNGELDELSLFQLIDQQLEAGVDGIVILGTTGESPCFSPQEHDQLIGLATDYIAGRCKVIAGTGSNSTREAIWHSQQAEKAGVDGLLVVNPYYNKPTQKGMLEHFTAIADNVNIPIILYNIEGRTGVNLETSTLLQLADHPNIVGVKEASGNLKQMQEVIDQTDDNFIVLSGDDGLTAELMKMGGHGVVSVISNIIPKVMKHLVNYGSNGEWSAVDNLHEQLSPLFDAAFIETNPQPVKTLLAAEGWCEEVFRLPLTTMEENNKTQLLKVWNEYKIQANSEELQITTS